MNLLSSQVKVHFSQILTGAQTLQEQMVIYDSRECWESVRSARLWEVMRWNTGAIPQEVVKAPRRTMTAFSLT